MYICSTVHLTSSPAAAGPNCIQIDIVYDDIGSIETSWGLYRVAGDNGRKDIIQFHYSASNDALYKESICLEEGDYEFSVYDSMANDICCNSDKAITKLHHQMGT